MKTFFIACLLLLSTHALAADAKPAKSGKTVPALNTNVIGSQEAPTVLNIVPWKDQAITIKQQAPTSRLLGQVLQPLDVNVLNREIEYYQLLNKKSTDSDLFLSQ